MLGLVSLPHPRTPIARHRQLLQKIVMAEIEVAEATEWSATNADEVEDSSNKLYFSHQRYLYQKTATSQIIVAASPPSTLAKRQL